MTTELRDVTECEDILRPLTDTEEDNLLELYKYKYGESNFHYLFIYNQKKWNLQLTELFAANPDLDGSRWISFRKTFYTHRQHGYTQYGTYVSLHMDLKQSVCCHSWEPNFSQLLECLRRTRRINWQNGPLLTNIDLTYCEQVKKIVAEKGATVQRARVCYGVTRPKTQVPDLTIPNMPVGFSIGVLHEAHAEKIHALWPNRTEGSLDYVAGLIKINKTAGIFRDSDNELVAWIFQNDYGGLGILQVLPTECRRGLGTLLAAYLCKQILQSENITPNAWHVADNLKSDALLSKIGFVKSDIAEWIQLNKAAD